MKIAYVTPYYNGDLDGRFGRFHDWVHALRDMDDPPFEFEVFALTASNTDGTLPSTPYSILGEATDLWGRKRNKIEFALNAPRLARDLKRREFDLVHVLTLDLFAYPVAVALSDGPLVVGPDVQGYFPDRDGSRWNTTGVQQFKHGVNYWLKDTLLAAAPDSTLVALSEYQKQLLTTLSLPEERVETIAPGVDPRFSPDPSTSSGKTVFLYVGDFSEYKGYPLFLRALSRLPDDVDWKAVVVGRGDPRREQIAELGIADRVTVEGFVPRENLPEYYRRADFFVMPSVDENGPNTIVEALACGTPVLSTDKSGINEYTPEGAGLQFDRTVEELRDCLVSAIKNKCSLSKEAGEAAPRFTAEQTIASLHHVYRRHLGGERRNGVPD